MVVIAYAVLVSLLLSISSTTTLCSPSRAMAGNSHDDIGYAITQRGFVPAIKVYCYYALALTCTQPGSWVYGPRKGWLCTMQSL